MILLMWVNSGASVGKSSKKNMSEDIFKYIFIENFL